MQVFFYHLAKLLKAALFQQNLQKQVGVFAICIEN